MKTVLLQVSEVVSHVHDTAAVGIELTQFRLRGGSANTLPVILISNGEVGAYIRAGLMLSESLHLYCTGVKLGHLH